MSENIQTSEHILSVEDILAAAPADAKEQTLEVPEWGGSVKIRTLSAGHSAQVKAAGVALDARGRRNGVDIARVELLQFLYGVVEPKFTEQQASQLQRTSSVGFGKVIDAIDALQGGTDEEVLADAEEAFPVGEE